MPETFYHVDRYSSLSVGSVLELSWPSRVAGNLVTGSTDENEEVLQELYLEGLSSHGARYAQAGLVCKEGVDLEGGWDLMSGQFHMTDLNTGKRQIQRVKPYIVQYEFHLELVRMLLFEEQQSRFQSYFGFEDPDEAAVFNVDQRSGSSQIVEVECSGYEIRDMDLVDPSYFGEIFSKGRTYWEGESGSENPTWEVVMEPPVKVVDIV